MSTPDQPQPVADARIEEVKAGYRAYPCHFHPDESTMTAIRDLLARIDALTAQVAELGALHGKIGLLAHSITGISDNAPTADCISAIEARFVEMRVRLMNRETSPFKRDVLAARFPYGAGKIVVSRADWERREKALTNARAALADLSHCVDVLCKGDRDFADAVVACRNTQFDHRAAIDAAIAAVKKEVGK